MQTKLQSFKESCAQTALGFSVALASQLVIFPWFGIHITIADNIYIGLWFTAISVVRSYIVRRYFNKKHDVILEMIQLNDEILLSNRKKDVLIQNLQERNVLLRSIAEHQLQRNGG